MRPWQTLMRTYTSAQLFRLVALFLYLCHLTGCVYWYVSMVELRRGVARGVLVWGAAQNWLPAASYAAVLPAAVPLLPADELAAATSDIGSAYTYALVWGLLNVSGFNFCKPGNLAQTVCSLFVAIVGISANAVIIGSVTTSLTRMNANANAERSRREAITSYLKGLKVPRDLLQVTGCHCHSLHHHRLHLHLTPSSSLCSASISTTTSSAASRCARSC